MTDYHSEIQRRRTFAIISHPDAGKTTLTEKLLLYGGAIQHAGAVASRKSQRAATSDWMKLEQQRGISVTSTVLQFEYEGFMLNLLDTPGHEDFSDDTYRTLMAADSAVMLIDKAKGVEPQTKKLFAVCRQRGIPIFTFVNKLDRPGRDPLDLMAELEEVLGIGSVAVNWPIGDGSEFAGVYDRLSREVHLFERADHGAKRAPVKASDLQDPQLEASLSPRLLSQLRDDVDLLEHAGEELDLDLVLKGERTPVFFGSALTNFGVELFLKTFIQMAPGPAGRPVEDFIIEPEHSEFSGFVFKIQANMDPNHRDRIAFMRVVSGKFCRDMTVKNTRANKQVRLTRPQKLFGQDRILMEEAFPGDVVGLTNPGVFAIGDTVCTGAPITFRAFPTFLPEHFAIIQNRKIDKYKQFLKGVEQLSEEGVVQLFYDTNAAKREPVLGVVGRLQLDVVQFRLESEYNVDSIIEHLPFKLVRWLVGVESDIKDIRWVSGTRKIEDRVGNICALCSSQWNLDYMVEQNPKVRFLDRVPEEMTLRSG